MSTVFEDATATPIVGDALFEIVDGITVELEPMGAYEELLALTLYDYLANHVSANSLGRAVHELLFELSPLNRNRRPDVAFVSYERWGKNQHVPRTPAWNVIPDLAVEVVSPTNTMNEIVGKVNEYFVAGVRVVWLVLPEHRQFYVYESAKRISVLNHDDELTDDSILAGFRMPLADFFEEPPADDASHRSSPSGC